MVSVCFLRVHWAWLSASLLLAAIASSGADEGCAVCNGLHHATEESSPFSVITFANGVKRMVVVRVDFEDLPGTPSDRGGELTKERLLETVNGPVASYFDTVSYGKSSVALKASDITGVLRLPDTAESYAQEPLLERLTADARRLAAEAGYALGEYERIAVVMSSLTNVPGSLVRFRGYAGIGGLRSWYQGDFSAKLVAHELGHNYGLGHASSWWVPDGQTDPLHSTGEKIEYGDIYDVMGNGNLNSNAQPWFSLASLAQLGWLPDTVVKTVSTNAQARLYRFDHREVDFDVNKQQLMGLRIPLSASRAYWLSYRGGFSQLAGRMSVQRADEANRKTLLVDAHPGGSLNDAGLAVGETFSEFELGLSATVTNHGGAGSQAWIDVEVAFLPEVTFQQADISVNEDQGTAVLELIRNRPSETETIVEWDVLSGTAVVGEDVVAGSGTVRWAPYEEGVKSIELTLLRDAEDEAAESFVVRLSQITGAILPVRDAVVHIIEPGVPDPTFNTPLFDGRVRDFVVQGGGNIYVVGDFEKIGDAFGRGVGRLLPCGDLDKSFDVEQGVNVVPVYSVIERPGDRIVCGGGFIRYDWQSAHGLVRLKDDGTRDESHDAKQVTGTVHALVPQAEGGYMAVGSFADGVARFFESGERDLRWSTDLPAGSIVTSLIMGEDGGYVIAGSFPVDAGGSRWGVMRLDPLGNQAGWLGVLESEGGAFPKLVRGEGDEIMVAGEFSAYEGVSCSGVAMIDEAGMLDTAFQQALGAGPNGAVNAVLYEPEGRWILVGAFDEIDGQERRGVARLTLGGHVDSWNPGKRLHEEEKRLHGTAVAIEADGNVLLGLTDADESRGWVARVASALSRSPGLLEMASSTWTAKRGAEIILPVVRRRGEEGDVNVRYTITTASAREGEIRVNPTGLLSWADGDTQPQGIRVVMPSDPGVKQISVALTDAGGGAQTTTRREAVIVLEELSSSALWLYHHFGVEANVASAFDSDVDTDQDGLSNLLEYALDRDPRDADGDDRHAYPKVGLSPRGPSEEESLEIELNLPATLRPDIRYEILMGDGVTEPYTLAYHEGGLNGWVMSEGASLPYIVPLPDDRQMLRFREPLVSSGSLRRFMQLRVQLLR